jgi:predicted aspartyl protease
VSFEFPLLTKRSIFGLISDPRIPVMVPTRAGPEEQSFLVDTGADVSLAPRYLAEKIGLPWERLPQAAITGIEQGGMRARVGRLPISVGDVNLSVRCFFVEPAGTLFVLGRVDFLDRFILTIDQPGRRIVLEAADG